MDTQSIMAEAHEDFNRLDGSIKKQDKGLQYEYALYKSTE
jgi:hypothetical protein